MERLLQILLEMFYVLAIHPVVARVPVSTVNIHVNYIYISGYDYNSA